jgi:cytochrome c oxidase subunit 1/cytochrome c oxidase subunit I+III
MPEDTPLPLLLALSLVVMLAGLLAHVWWLSAVVGVISLGLISWWLWPRASLGQVAEVHHG